MSLGTGRTMILLGMVLGWGFGLSGCSVLRGIPSHGGGKRFDEEERAVAGTIRRTIADMNLKELQGKTVLINIEAISHNGGGYITFPGLSSASGGYNSSKYDALTEYAKTLPLPGVYVPYTDNSSNNQTHGWNGNVSATLSTNYNATPFASDPDLNYFKAALTMKAQHNGLVPVAATPDFVLYVLVDVLGINRSRCDSLLFWSDTLEASCEVTYYAQDAKTGKLAFRARQASSAAKYKESSLIGFVAYQIDRSIETTRPTALPVDGEELEATAPLAKNLATTATLAAVAPPAPAENKLDPSMKEYLDTQVRNADLQVQVGNLEVAQQLINAVRAVDARYPGLAEVESRLQKRRQSR